MHMNVLIISLILMALIAIFFIAAVRASKTETAPANPGANRMSFIVSLILAGIVITYASLRTWPHTVLANANTITVNAVGEQWSWDIDKTEVPVGSNVIFNVTTKDVNHGFGLVDPTGKLVVQTQAMPGYINRFQHTFPKAGIYKIICMEFCGIAHHDMIEDFVVIEKQGE